MNQKIKSMLQSSDKGSYYNYLLLSVKNEDNIGQ
jgi:hypothetical protein